MADIELTAADRRELHRSEMAFGRVFARIHRVEWKATGRAREVELHCEVRALGGVFVAAAKGRTVRGALQALAEKILKQKRRDKIIAVTRRRTAPLKVLKER